MEISNSTPQRENPQRQASETLVQAKSISRHEFMKLLLEERRCILAAQAELMLLHYEQYSVGNSWRRSRVQTHTDLEWGFNP
ncbi:hypothetical protein [Nostoc sp.]|uniref:hypothetical protein n=1 Tax=Nostoc sp. TaxID=1180 RepID=UPI002FFC15C3